MLYWLSWNSLCKQGWPQIQESTCLCLPSARIKLLATESLNNHNKMASFSKIFKYYICVQFMVSPDT